MRPILEQVRAEARNQAWSEAKYYIAEDALWKGYDDGFSMGRASRPHPWKPFCLGFVVSMALWWFA